jgi:adenosine deaminase
MNRLAIHIPAVLSVLLPTASAIAVMGCSADGGLLGSLQGTANAALHGPPGNWPDVARRREAAAARVFERARVSTAALSAFLRAMPKGADLHTHLSGAASTENLIRWGQKDGMCVRPSDATVVLPPCTQDTVPLSAAFPGSALYQTLVSAWSLTDRSAPVRERHQRFFDAFGKFSAVANSHVTDMVDEVVRRAAAQGVVHVEIIVGFQGSAIGRVADQLMDKGAEWTDAYLAGARESLLQAPEFRPAIARSIEEIGKIGSDLRTRWRCDSPQPEPACEVSVRYLIHGVRTQSREHVFGQWVYAFELAQVDPRVVGVNLVAPEENSLSLSHYEDEMRALSFLGRWNRAQTGRQPVHIALHAGELVPEVLPAGEAGQMHLRSHIRRAVQQAGAERIGHAVDILSEEDAADDDGAGATDGGSTASHEGQSASLLRQMAQTGVAVEVCLTSNQAILGAESDAHPLSAYLAAGVPVTLATDDEGILRTDLSAEYLRAAQVQRVDYRQLKTIARTGLEKSFLPGPSYWENPRTFTPVAACSGSDPSAAAPSPACQTYLAGSQRAMQQWRFERKLAAFEATQTSLLAVP